MTQKTMFYWLLGALVLISPVCVKAEEQEYAEADNLIEAEPVMEKETITIEEEPVITFEGTVSQDEDMCEYTWIAPRDGRYYVGISEMQEGCSVDFAMTDSFGNSVLQHQANQMVQLQKEETYIIQISYYNGNTGFLCSIQQQKPDTDISEATEIQDQIMFKEQKNVYRYTPEYDGYYCFAFDEKPLYSTMKTMIWDQYDTEMGNTYDDSYAVYLEAGEEYQIQVRQYEGFGPYTLKIYGQKQKLDISGYTEISDSMEYDNQHNYYWFTAPVDGAYLFDVTETAQNLSLKWALLENENEIWSESYNGSERTELEAGHTYWIACWRKEGYGDYELGISYPASAQDYLDDYSLSTGQRSGLENGNADEKDTESQTENTESEPGEGAEGDSAQLQEILNRLNQLESEVDAAQEENKNLKKILEENEIEYD